jgi:hypothetical protein
MQPDRPHPLALRGTLDPQLSRWQWLVKWVLAIPHVLALMALVPVFVVLTIVAGVAILFTGRYPEGIFRFNVGVLRWAWRVSFYSYGVLGTDRYPPFSLDPADYPADLDVAYPARLSRGLVLVKWWLLALPHLIIVGLLTGGLTWTIGSQAGNSARITLGGGVVGLLVIVAAVVLLVRGRYPQPLFDLVLGLQRWVYRVIAYVALMTDVYPPFRLDQGGEEPRPTGPGPVAPSAPPATASPPRTPVAG